MALKKSKEFLVSDQSLNSYGFRVKTDGGDFSKFKKNPVHLYIHDYNQVVGNWGELRVDGEKIYAIAYFDDRDPEAMRICNKVEDGLVNCASIGFTPLAWDGDMVTEWILKEISTCPLGSNENAVALYDDKGSRLDASQAKEFLLSIKQTDNNPDINTETQMNEKTKKALIALAVQLGITLVLSDSEERFEDIATKAGEKITQLQDSFKTLSEARAVKMVDDALAANKITADDKEIYLAQAKLNPDHTEKFLEKMPVINLDINSQLSKIGGGKDKDVEGKDTDPRKDWSYADWSKKDSTGLASLRLSDSAKFKALYKAEYGEDFEG